MKKQSPPKTGGNAPEDRKQRVVIPQWMTYAGLAAVAGGLYLMQKGSLLTPGTADWIWYLGAVLTVTGAVCWLTAGMNRAQLFEWTRGGLIALTLALAFRWAVAEPYRIPSGSMETTLHGDPGFGKGDRVWVNKWIYGIRVPFMNKRLYYGKAPERWDIVVFKTVEEDAVHKTLVKRIVGMPGERIQIRGGRVYANGEPLELPPGMPPDTFYTTPFEGAYGVKPADEYSLVPEGHYLLLGDNSAHSRDGRWFGWMPNEHLVGRVACIWWPPPRWRDFTGFSQTLWWRCSAGLIVLLLGLRLFIGRTCPLPAEKGARGASALVAFLSYGFRLPLTRFWLARWGRPVRGDLVLALVHTESGHEAAFVGRIAGMPGEKVSFQEGRLLVNGQPAALPDGVTGTACTSSHPEAVYGRSRGAEYSQVPDGHYFILSPAPDTGDEAPADSRVFGWVPENGVLGRVLWRWWPLGRLGRI